jgi:2-C-methyl-D-erythritol 4-phosphate cytidylyltransferase
MDMISNDCKVSVILLAGGKGVRMNKAIPKQYLTLKNKPIARYSFEVFISLPQVKEIIVVCEPQYQKLFALHSIIPIKFAEPGERRQDSVYNGLQKSALHMDWICVHDSARPFIDNSLVHRVIDAAVEVGAATAGMPLKFTVKESDSENLVKYTLDRNNLWEIQTPQVIRTDLLHAAFNYVNQNRLTVTDDVSLVELIGMPVKLVKGNDINFKITTPQDLVVAEQLLQDQSLIAEYAKL